MTTTKPTWQSQSQYQWSHSLCRVTSTESLSLYKKKIMKKVSNKKKEEKKKMEMWGTGVPIGAQELAYKGYQMT